MKKIAFSVVVILILGISFLVYRAFKVPETPIHYHANFAVFINNKQVDFKDPSYMHLAPCLADTSVISFNKLDNVHLHDQVGNVVHVHQGKIVWNDLFKSVKYDLFKETTANNSNKVSFYLNGKKVDKSVLSSVIKKEDQLLITADEQEGPQDLNSNEYFSQQYAQVGTSAIDYDNGTKGAERCGAEGKRSFFTRLKIGIKTLNSDIEI